jgi:amicyanin
MAIGIAVLGLAACGGAGASPTATSDDPSIVAAASGDPTTTMDMTMNMSMPASTAPAGPAVATTAVSINNFAFTPAAITVKVGATVTWTNNDEEPHTVFSSAAGMKSPVLASNQNTYSFTFTAPGTYEYNCTIHPFMHGTVTVTA